MKSDFLLAFNEIAEARKLPREIILEALKAALVSAYKRDASIGSGQHVEARIDEKTGSITVWAEKEVVDDVANYLTEVTLSSAQVFEPDAQLGDMVVVESTPDGFGRIAAQTAKQVILQRMREAEREAQFQEFTERKGDLVAGTVQSDSSGVVTLGLGRSEAILPHSQQMPGEKYRIHDKVRAYVMDVKKSNRGPQIFVSRTHKNMLRRLLEYEVPEIYNGIVEIKSIAREPGARSKVAVAALQEGADPVGACVGMKGVRIQSIVRELNGEKIDVIEWNADPKIFIAKALSPSRVNTVFLDDDPDQGKTAVVMVPDDQLSLAIGREGQNARLAAKLTGWRIDIKSITEAAEDISKSLDASELSELIETHAELFTQFRDILQRKAEGKPILPEDYTLLARATEMVETLQLESREAGRAESRVLREAARARVPVRAYQHPLDDTDLPHRIYNHLAEMGYSSVGQVMEQFFLEPKQFVSMNGVGAAGLEAIEKVLNSIDFSEPEIADIDSALVETGSIPDSLELQEVAEAEGKISDIQGAATPEPEEDDEFARAERAALVARLDGQTDVAEAITLPEGEAADSAGAVDAEDLAEYFVDDDPYALANMSPVEAETVRREKAKQLRRRLIFDEDLGQMVAKRRRKPGRNRSSWEVGETEEGGE